MSFISPVYNNLAMRPMERGRKLHNKPPSPSAPPKQDGIIWLQVPYSEKDKAKRLGARWNNEHKRWYAKIGPNLSRFERWIKK